MKKIRIAIIGGGRIGINHARIFNNLNTEIASIVCQTKYSASKVKSSLKTNFGIHTEAFSNLDEALKNSIDAVSICTPPQFHFDQIISAFDLKLPVFCEKPLFWDNPFSLRKTSKKLKLLENHSFRNIYVNTSNVELLKSIGKDLPPIDQVKSFTFSFYTRGVHTFENIAVDLLPHGLSLIIDYFGDKTISNFKWELSRRKFSCNFNYGNILVKFKFHEKHNAEKLFSLKINNLFFKRFQKGEGDSYCVFMKNINEGSIFPCEDPFVTYIKKFIANCQIRNKNSIDEFTDASLNLKLMSTCMDKIFYKT